MGFCIAHGFVFCHRIEGFSAFLSDSLVIFFISRNGSLDDASARQSPIHGRHRHLHHDAYKVLAVLIPDSIQQLPALFKFRLQFMVFHHKSYSFLSRTVRLTNSNPKALLLGCRGTLAQNRGTMGVQIPFSFPKSLDFKAFQAKVQFLPWHKNKIFII